MWLKRIQRLLGVSPVIFREASSLSYSVRNTVVVFFRIVVSFKTCDYECGPCYHCGKVGQGEQVAICALERACVETVPYKGLWMLVVSPSSRQDPFKPPSNKGQRPLILTHVLSPWILQRKKIRRQTQNPLPRENHLSRSWYYWCEWKLRGECNFFNKSQIEAGQGSRVFLLPPTHPWGQRPPMIPPMFDQLCAFSRAAQAMRKASLSGCLQSFP